MRFTAIESDLSHVYTALIQKMLFLTKQQTQ
jgi:hypothetical protein